VILLFDGDEAGHRAADRATELIGTALAASNRERRRADVYVALLPGNQDPADFVASYGQPALADILDKAIPLVRYSLDRVLEKYDFALPEQRSRAELAALTLLHPLKGTALASDYLSYLSDRFNMSEVSEAEMRGRFEKMTLTQRVAPAQASDAPATEEAIFALVGADNPAVNKQGQPAGRRAEWLLRLNSLERELLYLFIEQVDLRGQLSPAFRRLNWSIEEHEQLANELLRIAEEGPGLAAGACLSELYKRLPQAAASLSQARIKEFGSMPPVRVADQLLFNIREIKLQSALERINGERRGLAADDPRQDELFKQLAALQQELAELRKKFRGAG
jgi:DNA primase